MKYYMYMDTPIGKLTLVANHHAITGVSFGEVPVAGTFQETKLLTQLKTELLEYFSRKREVFDLPLEMEGTEFQKLVWNTLLKIPYGEIRTYGQIAQAIGQPKASRAVGGANHCNPLVILVPCHRVIGGNHKLVGYGGGVEKKQFLLGLETSLQEESFMI